MSLRTLVLHTGALGDFLLACPAIAALRTQGPVDFFGHPERHAIAIAAGLGERCFPLDALALHEVFAHPDAPPPATLVTLLRAYDRAVLWMRDPDGALSRAFHAAGISEVITAPGLPHATWPGHVADYYLHTLGLPPIEAFRLTLPNPRPGLDVVIAPGSGSPGKNWPLPNFLELATALEAADCEVTWLLGPAEESLRLPPSARTLQCPPLVSLAEQLAAARLFVGNDSGPTHLAALCACPTVAVFGPKGLPQWRPLGANAHTMLLGHWPSTSDVMQLCAEMYCKFGKPRENT